MSTARICDVPSCGKRIGDNSPFLRVGLGMPFALKPAEDAALRDACSLECARWLVDEAAEHVRS